MGKLGHFGANLNGLYGHGEVLTVELRYHSHLSTQYTDGLFGPIVIHSPSELVPQVEGEKVVSVGDWYHTYSSLLVSSCLNPTFLWANISAVEALAEK